MYDRFTDRARKVMQLANGNAQRMGHEYIGTEHILLGLVEEGHGVAVQALKDSGVDLRKVKQGIERIVQHGPGDAAVLGLVPQTPRAKKVIEYAIEESRKLGHNYIGSEHILLGLLREEEGVAAQVLMNLGLTLIGVRGQVLKLLGQNEPDRKLPAFQVKLPIDSAEKLEFELAKGDERIAERMRSLLGPAHLDRLVRNAVRICWMKLPESRRNMDELETQIRRLVERALRDFREDSQAFGGE